MARDFFTDRSAMRTLDTHRIRYAFLAVVYFVITEIGRNVYRPYIYANDIDDLGLADSIGNLGGIMVQIFFMLAVFNSPFKKAIRVIIFLVAGYILYEIVQPILPRGVFDWKDIYGTVIGGVIALFVLWMLQRMNNRVITTF